MTEELAREALAILREIDAKKCNAIDRCKALNEALDKVDAESAAAMSKFSGGMPGLF